MVEREVALRLREIVSGFCDPGPRGAFPRAPFDASKPNVHDTKADYLAEKKSLDSLLDLAERLSSEIIAGYGNDGKLNPVSRNLLLRLEEVASADRPGGRASSLGDLVLGGAIDAGIVYSASIVLAEFRRSLKVRKQELQTEEAEFWSGKGRAPNHHARIIALRFAKVVARGTGKKPTLGTSSAGNAPSTDFGRAVEEIFGLLGITADFKRAAKWAVDQLTEADFDRGQYNALGLFQERLAGEPVGENALAALGREPS